MSKLIKNAITTYIPGNPGNPGSPYIAPQPARTVVEQRTVCTNGWETRILVANDGSVNFFSSNGTPVCTVENVLVYYPATSGSPAIPYSPPTATQISLSLNEGWNSYARSIDTLPAGALVEFTVKPGSHAALVAIGASGMEGVPIGLFAHGIMVDSTGIYVFEGGVIGQQLSATNVSGTKMRILRLADGRIAYVVGSTVVFSATPVGVFDTLHVYGMLYAAYDEVSSTTLSAGAHVAEPSVVMPGSGAFTMRPEVRAQMAGAGDFLVSANGPSVVMAGAGGFGATLSQAAEIPTTTMNGAGAFAATLEAGGRGYVTLMAIKAFGSDADSTAYGRGNTALPMLTASGYGGSFIPAQPTNGYVNLPFFTAWGDGVEISAGNGSVSLPLFLTQASEGDYGIGNSRLPLFRTSAYGGFQAADALVLMSAGVARSQQTQAIDLVLVLSSGGTLTSSFSMTREQALALMSVLQQSDSFAMLGVYSYSLLSGLRGVSLETISVGGRPDLYADGAVWVVNLDTSASVQYAHYGFNSFFRRGDAYYGVANDGIYRLSGSTDAGNPIEALIEFANTNLGSTQAKRMSDVYLASSGDSLVLKVVTNGRANYYTARWGGTGMQNQRVNPGKGLQSVYWQFGVLNQNGSDFELAGLEFLPIVTQRRVV